MEQVIELPLDVSDTFSSRSVHFSPFLLVSMAAVIQSVSVLCRQGDHLTNQSAGRCGASENDERNTLTRLG